MVPDPGSGRAAISLESTVPRGVFPLLPPAVLAPFLDPEKDCGRLALGLDPTTGDSRSVFRSRLFLVSSSRLARLSISSSFRLSIDVTSLDRDSDPPCGISAAGRLDVDCTTAPLPLWSGVITLRSGVFGWAGET